MRTTVEVIVEVDIDRPPAVAWDGPLWLRRRRLADSQALKTLLEAEAPL